jgi:hypothetical protein
VVVMHKEPYDLPDIPISRISALKLHESTIVGPSEPHVVSAEIRRQRDKYKRQGMERPDFVQQIVMVTEFRKCACQKMFVVTRTE